MSLKIGDIEVISDSLQITNANTINANLFSSTTSFNIPTGTEAQRPGTPSTGSLRYNTDAGSMEIYSGTEWTAL